MIGNDHAACCYRPAASGGILAEWGSHPAKSHPAHRASLNRRLAFGNVQKSENLTHFSSFQLILCASVQLQTLSLALPPICICIQMHSDAFRCKIRVCARTLPGTLAAEHRAPRRYLPRCTCCDSRPGNPCRVAQGTV